MWIICGLERFDEGGVDPMSALGGCSEGELLVGLTLGGGELLLWVELELFLMVLVLILSVVVVVFIVVGTIVFISRRRRRRSVVTVGDCTTSWERPSLTLCPCIHCCCVSV